MGCSFFYLLPSRRDILEPPPISCTVLSPLFKPKTLCAIRCMSASFSFGILACTLYTEWDEGEALCYFTHWALGFVTVYFLLASSASCLFVLCGPKGVHVLTGRPWLLAFAGFGYEIGLVYSIMCVLVFWMLLSDTAPPLSDGYHTVLNLSHHGMCPLLMWAEGWMSSMPFRMPHVHVSVCVLALYLLAQYARHWWNPRSGWVYPFLDPSSPGALFWYVLVLLLHWAVWWECHRLHVRRDARDTQTYAHAGGEGNEPHSSPLLP